MCLTAKGNRETEQISNRKDKQVKGVRLGNQSTGRETPFHLEGRRKCWKSVCQFVALVVDN